MNSRHLLKLMKNPVGLKRTRLKTQRVNSTNQKFEVRVVRSLEGLKEEEESNVNRTRGTNLVVRLSPI